MVTLKQIAEACGCSVATASKALNGMPDISRQTADAIRNTARAMGYIPNAAARALKTNRSRTIGLLLFLRNESIWHHELFCSMAHGIQSVTEAAGYDITPVTCNSESIDGKYLEYCLHRGYDGVILMCSGFDEPALLELASGSIPLVSIDYQLERCSTVLSDQSQGTGLLVRKAYEKGHRRIAYIHGEDNIITEARVRSFWSACDALNLYVPEQYLLSAYFHDTELCGELTRQLMSLPEPPTCILYPDDFSALGGISALGGLGLSIPEDVSIAGYDGISVADILHPKLTTYSQDAEEMGRSAGRLLLQTIENGGSVSPQTVVIPGRLHAGESIAAPRKN